jgi:hypothetical protein
MFEAFAHSEGVRIGMVPSPQSNPTCAAGAAALHSAQFSAHGTHREPAAASP